MKKSLFSLVALFCLLANRSFAQSYDTTTFYGKMNWQYQYLSKTPITTGFLREYGIDYLPLENYTGASLHDSNWVNLDDWRALYASIYSQQIVVSSHNLLWLDSANSLMNSFSVPGSPINFVVENFNYQGFDTNAVTKNLISISNGQLHDVAGRSQSPYITHSLFAVATTSQSVYTGSNQLIFRSQLFFGNIAKTISTIQVDPLGTGSYQTVTLNTPFTVNYTDSGLYTMNIKINYTDGTTNLGHTKIAAYINNGPPLYGYNRRKNKNSGTGPQQKDFTYSGKNPEISQQMTATKSYLGSSAVGWMYVRYASNNNTGKIVKPLIYVDGFDPDINDPSFPSSGDNYYFFTSTLDVDYNTVANITLDYGLDDQNSYDLIYVQWKNGTDYIERNAYLLESIITWVNSNKTPGQQNVIVGLSMGGLVTRFALRDMEMNGISHDTRLFVSHDAPMWGANVPVSIQAFAQQVGSWQIPDGVGLTGLTYTSLVPDALQAVTLFNSPAAKEMLIQRYILNTASNTLSVDNSAHTAFMNEMSSMGWPVNCNNLTLSNGGCSGGTQFSNTNSFVTLTGSYSLGTYFGNLWRSLAASIAGGFAWGQTTRYLPIRAQSLMIQFPLGIITTKGSVNLDFNATSVPSSGTSQIYRGNVTVKRQLFWGVFNSTSYLLKSSINSSSEMLPLDNAPGGNYDMSLFLQLDAINSTLHKSLGTWANLATPQHYFCFVPTVSSMALTNAASYLNSNVCNIADCLNPSGVKDFYAPQTSTVHVTNTQASTNWLLNVQSAAANCIKLCPTSWSISGSNPLCTSSIYSVTGAPSGINYAWSTSPTGLVSISNPAIASPTLSYQAPGNTTVSATLSTVCNSTGINVTKALNVGTVNNLTGTYTTSSNTYPLYTFNMVPIGPINGNFTWPNISNISISYNGSGTWYYGSSNTFALYLASGQYMNLTFNGTGTCGTVTATRTFQQSGGGYAIIASPNPASGTMNISINDAKDTASINASQVMASIEQTSTPSTRFSLYDINSGSLIKQWSYAEAENTLYTINLSGIKTGIYSLKMERNNKVATTKVIVR